jgi:mycoredoxin
MSPVITMYSTAWCGYCLRLKSQLRRNGLRFTEIDIESDSEAAAFVQGVNGGNRTVPTVAVSPSSGGPDVVLTNPRVDEVVLALAS